MQEQILPGPEALANPRKDRLPEAFVTLFTFRFGWHLLMTVGLMPIAGVDLPFVSHGMQGALQLALVGLVLGVYRRKDMCRAPLLPD